MATMFGHLSLTSKVGGALTERFTSTYAPPPVIVTLLASLVPYVILWPIVMQDVGNDFIPWLEHIATLGPLRAFATPFAAYNPPYLYLLALVSPLSGVVASVTLIKAISLGATVALALSTYRLLASRGVPGAARWAALVMLLPSTVLNAGLLGQCDALWAAPCVIALDCALRHRHSRMLLWCGVALAFKPQAILFAPFIIAILIKRRVPIWQWLIVPAVFLASLLPAWALGWPAANLIGNYGRQAATFPQLSLNAPNLWFVVQAFLPDTASSLAGLALASAVAAMATYVAHFSVRMPRGDPMILVALCSPLLAAGLLPHMHERYFFLADIISLIWWAVSRRWDAFVIAVTVQAGSTLAVLGYLFGAPWLVDLGFAPMAVATFLVVRQFRSRASNDNPLLARA
jgi:Gpi18-like mannosyltransferase